MIKLYNPYNKLKEYKMLLRLGYNENIKHLYNDLYLKLHPWEYLRVIDWEEFVFKSLIVLACILAIFLVLIFMSVISAAIFHWPIILIK